MYCNIKYFSTIKTFCYFLYENSCIENKKNYKAAYVFKL